MSTINVHSIALERSILKELMMSGNSAVEQATSVLGTYLEHFYDDNRRNIYKTILDLYEENRNITSMIVFEKLKSSGKYNSLYRDEFARINSARISGDLIECCSMLLDYSNKRRIGDILTSVVQKATAENTTYHHLIDEITTGIDSIANNSIITTADSIDNILNDTIGHIKRVHKAYINNEDLGINPGFKGLKNMIGCLEGNQLLVLAGRPAQGKTAFALSMAIEIAKQVPIAFFSLEMDKKQLMARVISRENQVPLERIRKGNLTNDDKQAISDNTNIKDLRLIIDDNSDLDLNMLRNKIRKYQNDYGIKVVIIDYLQLMIAPNERSREQEVAKMTRTLKKLSKIYDIPIMILAQLNRGVEQRGEGAIPQLSDLRECISVDSSFIYSYNGIHNQKYKHEDIGLLSIDNTDNTINKNYGNYLVKEANIVYRITTQSGRYLDCTAKHSLMTSEHYKQVRYLTIEDELLIPLGFIDDNDKDSGLNNYMLHIYNEEDILTCNNMMKQTRVNLCKSLINFISIPAKWKSSKDYVTVDEAVAQSLIYLLASVGILAELSVTTRDSIDYYCVTIVNESGLYLDEYIYSYGMLSQDKIKRIHYDKIDSIQINGEQDVFDLSVPGDNNYIVNGIWSHNSGAIEQDADVVMFVHQGNIHVAKQRQGTTGVVPLSYDKTFTGFWDTDVAAMNCL